MSIFFATHLYTLGWQLGIDEATAEFKRQVDDPNEDSLPCVRTLARLRELDDCQLWFDTGSTRIGHSRSLAFADGLSSLCDIWFTCDDDCEADTATLQAMLDAVRDQLGICVAPYFTRGSATQRPTIALEFPRIFSTRTLASGAVLVRASSAGLGLTAISRRAMSVIDLAATADLRFMRGDAGQWGNAHFLERITPDGRWLGEDIAFFSRIPDHLPIEALVTGNTVHAGQHLDLSVLARRLGILPSQKTSQIEGIGTLAK